MAKENKSTELDLFNQWRKTQDPQHFQALYTSMKPLIYRAAEKASYGSNLPESAHRVYAAQNFFDALRTFKPNSGAALQTHVFNAVHQKAKRLNYMFGNLGHAPEPRAMQIGLYQTEVENMKNNLGREPSAAEIADHLGWSLKQVQSMQKEIHKDLQMSEGTEEHGFYEGSVDEEIIQQLYYELPSEEKLVYEHVFGLHGKPKMLKANGKIDYEGIARKVGFSSSKARAIWTRVRAKATKELQR